MAKYPDKPQSVKQLVIATGRKAAKPVQWREGSRPGAGSRSRMPPALCNDWPEPHHGAGLGSAAWSASYRPSSRTNLTKHY